MGGTLKDLQGASAKLRRELAESGAERDEALMGEGPRRRHARLALPGCMVSSFD